MGTLNEQLRTVQPRRETDASLEDAQAAIAAISRIAARGHEFKRSNWLRIEAQKLHVRIQQLQRQRH
jgi:hypothetical protein